MAAGESDIQQAVAQLAESLDFSEEALVHAKEVEDSSGIVFYRYRQAFGDDAEPSQVDVCGGAKEARLNAIAATAALQVARKAIRDYVQVIAPALQLTATSQVRASPTGEELLVTTSRRPKSLQEIGNRTANATQDVGDLINTAADAHQKFTFTPLTPPEVTGAEARIPQLHASHEMPAGVASSDVIGTLMVSAALTAKAATVIASRIATKFGKYLG